MKYGFCTGFATTITDAIDYDLVRRIKKAGYDYVEFPLMLIESLDDDQFNQLLMELESLNLACNVTCNLFPASIHVVGPDTDRQEIEAYLQHAFDRAARLGIKKIVFGSSPSRRLPAGYSKEAGYRQLASLIKETMIPLCEKYGFEMVIEPIGSGLCNLINSLPDGMKLVNMVNSPYVTLLADSVHLLSDNENPDHITLYADFLNHVHISELDRILPEYSYSDALEQILKRLKAIDYDKTISFEPMPSAHIDKALGLLKDYFDK